MTCSNCDAATFTASRNTGMPASRQRCNWIQAARITHTPMSFIRPISSASASKARVDIVISSTGASAPILTLQRLQSLCALPLRHLRQVDQSDTALGLLRQVQPQIAFILGVAE